MSILWCVTPWKLNSLWFPTGVSMFTIQRHEFNFVFIFASLLAIVIARACVVYPLTFLLNFGRKNRIPMNFQVYSATFSLLVRTRPIMTRYWYVATSCKWIDHHKLFRHSQHMMMFSGLRGAIAFALALRSASSPERYVIMTTTAIIVMLTVILCGGTTTAMLSYLKIRVGVSDEDMSMHR